MLGVDRDGLLHAEGEQLFGGADQDRALGEDHPTDERADAARVVIFHAVGFDLNRLVAIGLLHDVSFPERDHWQEDLSSSSVSMQDWVCDVEDSYELRGQNKTAKVRVDAGTDDDDAKPDDDAFDDDDASE